MLTDSDPRNNCFDFIRFFGALAVLYSHNFATVGLPQPTYFAGETAGSLGVFIFFAVSGYLVQQSWDRRPDKMSFLVSRALRIFPGLFVCLLFCAFVLGPSVSSFSASAYFQSLETYKFVYSNLMMFFIARYDALPGVFVDNEFKNHINSSLWTIRYEVFMYLALLFLCLGFQKRRAFVLLSCVAGCCAIWIYGKFVGLPEPGELLWRIGFLGLDGRILKLAPFFLVGALIAYLPRRLLSVPTAITIAVFSLFFYQSSSGILVLWFALPYCIIVFSYAGPKILNKFGKHGDFSYGLYLYAFPVQQLMAYLEISTNHWWLGIIATFFITLGLAVLSWKFIELPFLNLRKRWNGQSLIIKGDPSTVQ